MILLCDYGDESCELFGLGGIDCGPRCVLKFRCNIGVYYFACCEVGEPEPELFVGGGMGEGACLRKASPLQCELCVFLGEWI